MKSACKLAAAALMALLLIAAGCSKKAVKASETAADLDTPEVADAETTTQIDLVAEQILQSADKAEADEWLKDHPTSHLGGDESGQPIRLAPIVARLRDAGAERIVISKGKIGERDFPSGMVIVLPGSARPRQRLFKMDTYLSRVCQQTPVLDRGQKYLHYGFD